MPEADTNEARRFFEDVPQESRGFFPKGAAGLDWGMRSRFSRIFRPDSGHTVMLAIDHGYFQGPTTGLERVDLKHRPAPRARRRAHVHAGILRSVIPPDARTSVVIRASGGPSILKDLSDLHGHGCHLQARGVVDRQCDLLVFVGGEYETRSVHNMTRLADEAVPPWSASSTASNASAKSRPPMPPNHATARAIAAQNKPGNSEDGGPSVLPARPFRPGRDGLSSLVTRGQATKT